MSSVCLCMMVKNESAVISRALNSVLGYIDAWSILDTGSTDGTQELARRILYHVPGAVVERGWEDFGTGRTQAFKHARMRNCDYILVMDADQTLVVEDRHWADHLTLDGYNIDIHHGNLVYPHPWLLKSSVPWRWEGATHEYIACDQPYVTGNVTGIHLVEHADSSRRVSGAKGTDDLAILLAAYEDNPQDARTVFYLAQACADLGKLPCALKHYRERVKLGGWLEEQWCAQYRIGTVHEAMSVWEYAADAYLAAFNMHPSRAEPLYRLGRGHLRRKQFRVAALYFEQAVLLRQPKDALFCEYAVYQYAARWGLSMALRLLGVNSEAEYIEDSIMGAKGTPDHIVSELLQSRISRTIGTLP